ncbi:hypothetical protein [Clostridium sp. BJN0001]|uniref:hypothetical protein n=1 Tax=Clostridium sp. BJN0001 TaxID=2930219 RepID=UPI001FD3ECC0|nr:hypothetical protein [Clostridium sp. BJN0001]
MILIIKNLYQILLTKKEQILALFTIDTSTIHLYDDMYNFLKKSFYKQYEIKEQNFPDVLKYLSEVYASIVMTSIKWCLQNNGYEELAKHPQIFFKLAKVFDLP